GLAERGASRRLDDLLSREDNPLLLKRVPVVSVAGMSSAPDKRKEPEMVRADLVAVQAEGPRLRNEIRGDAPVGVREDSAPIIPCSALERLVGQPRGIPVQHDRSDSLGRGRQPRGATG